jgi:aryl-alcohol dehydrogenase-like predicted oxidoreductase
MQYKRLGRTGMKVSRLVLGTWNFGTFTDEKTSHRIMDEALDGGINFIDTANAYPAVGHRGESERIIGRWFALGAGRRERTVLTTKVYSYGGNPYDGPNEGHGLSTYKIRRHLNDSLQRMQTDHLELYQMHHVDYDTGWEELWDAFQSLFLQGKIDYVGSSNFGARHLMQAQAAARERNFLGLVSEQHRYNLLCRLPELEMLPTAQALGMGLLAYSPLEGGRLAGSVMPSADGNSRRAKMQTGAEGKAAALAGKLAAYSALCRALGESEPDVAIAWLLANPGVTAVVIGPRTVEQLRSTLHALDIALDKDTLAKLDEIFPGPGGAAPAAYAW